LSLVQDQGMPINVKASDLPDYRNHSIDSALTHCKVSTCTLIIALKFIELKMMRSIVIG